MMCFLGSALVSGLFGYFLSRRLHGKLFRARIEAYEKGRHVGFESAFLSTRWFAHTKRTYGEAFQDGWQAQNKARVGLGQRPLLPPS